MTEIELTDVQRQALQAEHGRPVDVVDPGTQQRYVLIAREQFERVRSLLEELPPSTAECSPRIAPPMLRSMRAYWRELPGLLKCKSKARRWVAYHADERIGFGRTEAELYQEAFRRGLQRGDFYVGILEADSEGIPPWGTLEADWSLYEADDSGDLPPNVACQKS